MANNIPLVSIIMPTYNRAHYIKETIQSILSQTYTNWELLIMDDGSDDNTESTVAAINDSRIYYYNEGRIGITGVLKNNAIKLSAGTLLAFMDSDDLWTVNKLQVQVEALLRFPQAGFSFTNGYHFSKDVKTPDLYFYERRTGEECRNLFEDYMRCTIGVRMPTVMAWRNKIDQAGLFKTNRIFTDFSFIGKLAYVSEAVILYEPLFCRRVHTSNNFAANWVQDYEEVFETILTFKEAKQISAPTANATMFISYIHMGEQYVRQNDRRKGLQCFLKAWQYAPTSIIPVKKILKTIIRK